MITPTFNFFDKLIDQFTWRRLFFVITTLLVCLGALIIYETYTGHFRLDKIERSTKILHELTDLSPKINAKQDKRISDIFEGLSNELDSFVNHKQTPFSLPTWLLKSFSALAPWILASIIMFLTTSTEDHKHAIAGVTLFAIPLAIIGAILPDYKYPSLNYIAYPIVSFGITIFIVLFWQNKQEKT